MMNIVIIDGKTLNPGDLSWDNLKRLGHVEIYDQSEPEQGLERLKDADIVLTNKYVFDAFVIDQLPNLKCICVTATGYNIIDIEAATRRGIVVCNVSGYSTPSTAQHTIALVLELTNHCGDYSQRVSNGDWTRSNSWSYVKRPTIELAGLTMGIIGLGTIGKRVSSIANAIGMKVIAYSRTESWGVLSLEELYQQSDIISLHCPLNDESHEMINARSLTQMKPSALLINTSRGGLINETDLRVALLNRVIAGAALDVLQDEPPPSGHPLYDLQNCFITPHIAWSSRASRGRLLDISIENVRSFIEDNPQNSVN